MKLLIIIIILVLIFFGCIFFGFNVLKYRDSYGCDIGENATAGDFKLTSSSWYNNWYNEKSCAIEDCFAYNNYQQEIGSKLRCVV